ncbi:hypothetical protein [Adhaeribacter radiodurans]|uniref:Uncharacterized protein n=1 Tax=Adhaeribacter radiodurans TaxID=2745197 RepID=A0A7L7L5M2_9BACT|nr:hypothetical protein [Adhaeribacter radiodurans]QMU28112.1 hypothetical protein HUW48_08660 [Adhaeribacter radiodurans]
MSLSNEHEKYLKELGDGYVKSTEAFDKTLILISSGGLVLSMTLIEKIIGSEPILNILLVLSWICLALTLTISLTGHFYSTVAHGSAFNRYIRIVILNTEETINEDLLNKEWSAFIRASNKNNKILSTNNYLAFCVLIIGIIFLIIYASINILNHKPMLKENTKISPNISPNPRPKPNEKGLPLPIPPRNPPSVQPQQPPKK